MAAQGFAEVIARQVEYVDETLYGCAVVDDPVLTKNACSQLALLSEEAYRAGLEKIKTVLAAAEARQTTLRFRAEWPVHMLVGYKPRDTS